MPLFDGGVHDDKPLDHRPAEQDETIGTNSGCTEQSNKCAHKPVNTMIPITIRTTAVMVFAFSSSQCPFT